MKIYGLQKTTLLDYPGKVASILFTAGCNLRCPYCHNAEMISARGQEDGEALLHLQKRKNLLEGVVITGGEPTLQEDLMGTCQRIKEMGYDIKLDTNGTNPSLLQELSQNRLIDYVAMDIKTSKERYGEVCGIPLDCEMMKKIEDSVDFLLSGKMKYEFRTTVIKEYHTETEMKAIGEWIRGADAYFLQTFAASDYVPNQSLTPPPQEDLEHFRDILTAYVPNTQLR